MYENQKVLENKPVKKQIKIVCVNKISPIFNGWVIWVNKKLLIKRQIKKNICRMSGNSLIKNISFGG